MRLYSVVGKKHGTAFLFCLRVFVLLLLIWTLFQIADSVSSLVFLIFFVSHSHLIGGLFIPYDVILCKDQGFD